MIIVKNNGLCNIRIEVDTKQRFLIKAGGEEVELPDSVKEVNFFKSLVKNRTVEIVKTVKDKKKSESEVKAEESDESEN